MTDRRPPETASEAMERLEIALADVRDSIIAAVTPIVMPILRAIDRLISR